MQITGITSLLLVGALCSGCATDDILRKDAQALSVYVEKVKTDGAAFQQARDTVAKARVATLNYVQANALASEQSVQRDFAAREIAQDKQWLALFESLRKAPETVTRQRQAQKDADAAAAQALATAKSAVDIRAARLTEASSAFADLAEKKSTKEELKFHREFLDQVRAGFNEKSDDAKAQSGEAAQASASKSSN
jgi:hypothetical protein